VLLSPKQRLSIRQATNRINLWHGSIRSGKTFASMLAWLDFVANAPPGALLMVGKTKETLERNVLDVLMAPDMWAPHPSPVRHTRGSNVATIFGRLVYIVGANDAKAEGRIRGLTLIGAYVDEASLLPSHGYWLQLLGRLSLPGARLFATTNPDTPMHWLKKEVIDRAGELALSAWHFVLDDNPSLTEVYKAQIRAENVGVWFKRFILGLWVLAEGAIFDMFEPEVGGRHVVADVPRDAAGRPAMDRWTLAIDYGTTNPFVALLMGRGIDETGTGRLYVAREWRHDSRAARRQLTDSEYSAALRTWVDGLPADLGGPVDIERMIVDPSAASFSAQLWRDGWHGVRGAENAVADGIRATSSLLAADRLRIVGGPATTATTKGTGCDGLIAEKSGYVWDPKAAERGIEQPLKVADHGPDAERYGVMGTRRIWRHWLSVDLPEAAAA
jgi:PBSX family phage terminase large subunit